VGGKRYKNRQAAVTFKPCLASIIVGLHKIILSDGIFTACLFKKIKILFDKTPYVKVQFIMTGLALRRSAANLFYFLFARFFPQIFWHQLFAPCENV
jgi:hypothetical protein